MRRKYIILLLIAILISTLAIGCRSEGEDVDENIAASVSINSDSNYIGTFTELNLGSIFDFNLKLHKADRSIVTIWVEGYKDGNPMSEESIAELAYRFSPKDVEEGHMGLAIFNHNFNSQLLIYSANAKSLTNPKSIEGYSFNEYGIIAGDYAIGSEIVSLESGQEKLLAAYRQADYSLRTIDYDNEDSIEKMIEEDEIVLLFKIMVEVVDDN